jgi:hypothetical protein
LNENIVNQEKKNEFLIENENDFEEENQNDGEEEEEIKKTKKVKVNIEEEKEEEKKTENKREGRRTTRDTTKVEKKEIVNDSRKKKYFENLKNKKWMTSKIKDLFQEDLTEELKKRIEKYQQPLDIDDVFDGAGDQAGLEVWIMVGMKPIRLEEDDSDIGTFNTGDCYIVLFSNESQDNSTRSRNIHYWLGKEANEIKKAITCFVVDELANKLEGSTKKYCENQEEESTLFLKMFNNKVKYNKGSKSEETLKKVVPTNSSYSKYGLMVIFK